MFRVAVGLIGLCLFALSSAPVEAKLKVFACYPEWRALAKELGGEAVGIFVATPPGRDPAQISVTPELIAALKAADLMICTGGGAESTWLPAALRRANNPKLATGRPGHFLALDFVKGLKAPGHAHAAGQPAKPHKHAAAGGNSQIQGDPHRIRVVAGRLARRMIELDRGEAKRYSTNTKTFIRGLGALIKTLEAKAAPLRGVSIATQRENSVYLLNWLKINSAAVIAPKAGVSPRRGDLDRIVARVPGEHIKFIVHAAHENPDPSIYVSKHAGLPLAKLPFTVGGTDDAKTFVAFYRSSVSRLLDALAGKDRP